MISCLFSPKDGKCVGIEYWVLLTSFRLQKVSIHFLAQFAANRNILFIFIVFYCLLIWEKKIECNLLE